MSDLGCWGRSKHVNVAGHTSRAQPNTCTIEDNQSSCWQLMMPTLLTLPDEIIHQICREFLGGDASFKHPFILCNLKSSRHPQRSAQPPPNNGVGTMSTCSLLHSILTLDLYSLQVFEYHISTPRGNEHHHNIDRSRARHKMFLSTLADIADSLKWYIVSIAYYKSLVLLKWLRSTK